MNLPMPPIEYRKMVGPVDEREFDNPSGDLVWGPLDMGPLEANDAYKKIFDFGCGCGRSARQLLQQKIPPEKYVGIDINKDMIKWCKKNLGSEKTEFHFHDVWSLTSAPKNKKNSTLPISQHGSDFSLINAHSVFTHIYSHQTEFYLSEFLKMLGDDGIIRTTWFIFNREWFPVLAPNQHCLYVNEVDPTQAVYYDWGYIVDLLKTLGLKLIKVEWSVVRGFQSVLYFAKSDSFENIIDNVAPTENIMGFSGEG